MTDLVCRFSIDDAQRAADDWGANCGPGALAAGLDMTLDEVRPHLVGFDAKRYTNPTMMFDALRSLGVTWSVDRRPRLMTVPWPTFGLARVQWGGPWMAEGRPIRGRYRHTHWIGCSARSAPMMIFDINAICAGGWIPVAEWSDRLVPWLLRQVAPKADGRWALTPAIQVYGRGRRDGGT